MSADPKSVGKRLQEARLARRLSREQVAERLGLSVAAVQHHENGDRELKLTRLQDYARLYKRPYGWLAAGEGGANLSAFDEALADVPPQDQDRAARAAIGTIRAFSDSPASKAG